MKLRRTEAEVIQQIHNEFDSAQERLLAEAKRIIATHTENNKAERLERMGFTSSEVVVKNKSTKNLLVKSKEQAELIEYYKVNYPFQKFLTEDELDRICKKYNLIYAPVSAYKNDVPEKNLAEIEQARKLTEMYSPKNTTKSLITYHDWKLPTGTFLIIWCRLRHKLPREIEKIFSSTFAADRYLKRKYKIDTKYLVQSIEEITIDKQGLFIAAPKSHFDTTALKQHGKYGMFNFSITEVKDPIVFRYCKGGIQVLSKWGLEGQDESLVNETLN